MFRKLLKKRARGIRFICALVLCVAFIAASPTSPSDDDGCGGTATTGTIVVKNHDYARVSVSVSGPASTSFTLNNGHSKTLTASTGSYTVEANDASGSTRSQVYSRSFNLSAGETETCSLYY